MSLAQILVRTLLTGIMLSLLNLKAALATSELSFESLQSLKSERHLPATQPLSLSEKKRWIQELDECTEDCPTMALQKLKELSSRSPQAVVEILPQARKTLVYLHSYSLDPADPKDSQKFLQREAKKKDLNIIALPLAGHDWDLGAVRLGQVQPQDWQADAELALKLGLAFNKSVIVKGNSLGGLLAIDLAFKFPQKIEKLVLVAPALEMTYDLNPFACLAQVPAVIESANTVDVLLQKSKIKAISEWSFDEAYLDKFLEGLCPLAKTMQKLMPTFLGPHVKTLLIYSLDDDAVDVPSLQAFSAELPWARKIIYLRALKIHHWASFRNWVLPGGSSAYDVIDKFIRE